MSPKRDWTYYNKEYVENKRSLQDIADDWDTYPNMIRRELNKLGFPLRGHSEAQSAALQSGRHGHPTRGTKRSEEVKLKISEGMAENWESVDPIEKERRSETAKQQWKDMSLEEKEFFRARATEGLRQSAKDGSILEKFLFENLREAGYVLQYHCKHVVSGTTLHVDLLIPSLRTVIEIDGPSHTMPIWGQGTLEKVQASDRKKNETLANHGYNIIRLQALAKNLSEAQKRKYLAALQAEIEKIKVGEASGLIILNIED